MSVKDCKLVLIQENIYGVLKDVQVVAGTSNQFKLQVDIVKIRQFTRRKPENQFEVGITPMQMIIDVPTEIGYDKAEQYIDKYWIGFVREPYNFYEEIKHLEREKPLNPYQLYIIRSEKVEFFEKLKGVFTYLCAKYDIQPSKLNFVYRVRSREGETGTLSTYAYIEYVNEICK